MNGKPAYTYNHVGLHQYTVNVHRSARARQSDHQARLRLRRQAAAKAERPPSTINGKKVGSGRVEQTNANIFSADDAADVGVDEGTNVSSAYKQHGNKFTGKIEKVRIDTK